VHISDYLINDDSSVIPDTVKDPIFNFNTDYSLWPTRTRVTENDRKWIERERKME